ncbi:hypothetical protein [Amycolatopsis orientalis]|uniref:hypothetical protein n=1 Tax=Amycolatopsis orientalis TaxID=31958 RepID=UPI000A57640A|nr:hypothetical protein [Amycolatopsis orientalis]
MPAQGSTADAISLPAIAPIRRTVLVLAGLSVDSAEKSAWREFRQRTKRGQGIAIRNMMAGSLDYRVFEP